MRQQLNIPGEAIYVVLAYTPCGSVTTLPYLVRLYFTTIPKLQEHLAKAKDYAEAHKMKLKSDALEAWELEQWRNKRQADLCQRESKFKHGKAQVDAPSS